MIGFTNHLLSEMHDFVFFITIFIFILQYIKNEQIYKNIVYFVIRCLDDDLNKIKISLIKCTRNMAKIKNLLVYNNIRFFMQKYNKIHTTSMISNNFTTRLLDHCGQLDIIIPSLQNIIF